MGEDGAVKRVSKDSLLPLGARVLVPRRSVAERPAHKQTSTSGPPAAAGKCL